MNNFKNNNIIDAVIKTADETGISVYLVGGAVRDIIRNCFKNSDLDFAVSERLDIFTAEFSKKIRGKIIVWDENDIRVVFFENGKYKHVDFAGLKSETIQDDLRLRDITINAVGINIGFVKDYTFNDLIDPLGGIKDIKEKKIRACSNSSFKNDPLRILRALRFSRKFDYSIDGSTYDLMKESSGLIKTVAKERIKNEFFTILDFKDQKISIEQLIDIGFINIFVPEIVNFKSIKQGTKHKYDLFDHSLETVSKFIKSVQILMDMNSLENNIIKDYLDEIIEEGVTRRSLLVFSLLLHDSGKRVTSNLNKGKVTFYGHEKAGAEINRKILKRLGLGKNAQNIVSAITFNHMRILHLSLLERLTERAVKRFVYDTESIFYETLILVIADTLATGDSADLDRILDVIQRIIQTRQSLNQLDDFVPLLDGNDIMDITGLNNSPEIGAIQKELNELECSGKLETREDALKWLREK